MLIGGSISTPRAGSTARKACEVETRSKPTMFWPVRGIGRTSVRFEMPEPKITQTISQPLFRVGSSDASVTGPPRNRRVHARELDKFAHGFLGFAWITLGNGFEDPQ